MLLSSISRSEREPPAALTRRWHSLLNKHLPLTALDSLWRYSRIHSRADPTQGWKIHISATVLTASDILSIIGLHLRQSGVAFKAPANLEILMRLNSGIYYGYPQIGKVFTIYPHDEDGFVRLAKKLAPLLSPWKVGPAVPFDLRFKDTCIYYRYGAFRSANNQNPIPAHPNISLPNGSEVPDRRDALPNCLEWLSDPLTGSSKPVKADEINPFRTRYAIYRAASQRGKGGVYEALDRTSSPPRTCIIKEGRLNGEVTWDGRDGCWRVENEARVLSSLASHPDLFPSVYHKFHFAGNMYLVMERIDGTNLDTLIRHKRKDLLVETVTAIAARLSSIVAAIHKAGWIWRDCKTCNFMIDMRGNVKAVDLEGACRVDDPDHLPWSTPSFVPTGEISCRPTPALDLFGLGVCLFQLLEGHLPKSTDGALLQGFTRVEIPENIRNIVIRLLDPDPSLRPCADEVKKCFEGLAKYPQSVFP